MDQNDIDFIPLKNLPDSGLTVWKYEEWKPGDKTVPNNVLIRCIDNLDKVSLVGRGLDGDTYFASSLDNVNEIINDLQEFIDFLKEYRDQ